ncbi:DUF445 domain-containing protein [Bacteroidota bacterium]
MIWTLPVIAALVGWFTNFLAVKMLFHPKKPFRVLGLFTIQGIFPKNQRKVAEKLGKMVADELLSSDDIRDKMNNPENMLSITELVEAKIDYYLNVTLAKQYPIVAALLSEKRKEKLKKGFMSEVNTNVPEMIEHYMQSLEERFNVEQIVRDRVNVLPPEQLEGLLMTLLKKEFKFIEYIGAVIGFLIGWIQVLLATL